MKAHQLERRVATTSLDLGLSEVEAIVESDHVVLAPGIALADDVVEKIAQDESARNLVESGEVRKLQRFSAPTKLFYSLLPTDSAPTLIVSGRPMHRIRDTNPWLDSQSKSQAHGRISGQVLDTCIGLGYAVMLAAGRAASVVTVELDPVVLELARLNPWSKGLFEYSRIYQIIGSIVEEIEGLGREMFSHTIHDPPSMALAEDLYSSGFYRELHRVARLEGRLFHHTGIQIADWGGISPEVWRAGCRKSDSGR